jgi:hypothetical protein
MAVYLFAGIPVSDYAVAGFVRAAVEVAANHAEPTAALA